MNAACSKRCAKAPNSRRGAGERTSGCAAQ
jgi:hypothetical protein